MRDLLITMLVFSSIPFILKRPYIGLLVFAWLGYMNPHRLSWGFAYNMPFAAIIIAVTFVAIIINLKELKKLPTHYSVIIVWLLWALWMNMTTPFALESVIAFSEWSRAIKIQLIALLTIMLMQDKRRIILLVWVIAISVGFYGVKGGIFTVLTGGNFMVFGPEGTFFSGNNALAIALLMVIPLMRFLQTQTNSKVIKTALLASMLLCGLSVLSSYSRGAFLAAAAVAFYFFLKSNKKIIIAPIILAVGLASLSFMPDKYFERLETIQTYEEDQSALGRINAWYFAFNVAKDNPIFGGGFGVFTPKQFRSYAPEPENYHDAHSIYFETLGEHGFIGAGLFLFLGLFALRTASKTIKQTKDVEELNWVYHLVSMAYVSLIGYAAGGLFLGLAYFDLYYHIIGLIILGKIQADKYFEELGSDELKVETIEDDKLAYEARSRQ